MDTQPNPLVEMFVQMAQAAKQIKREFIEMPYTLATSAMGGQVILAGQQNVPLLQSDFSNSLEWPFKIRRIKFEHDASHTYRDYRVRLLDHTYNQEWGKNPIQVSCLVQVDTGFYELPEPWTIRPMGGDQQFFIDNLDTVNPIQISVALHGTLLFPDRGE
jgi:hypothetical protein